MKLLQLNYCDTTDPHCKLRRKKKMGRGGLYNLAPKSSNVSVRGEDRKRRRMPLLIAVRLGNGWVSGSRMFERDRIVNDFVKIL
jgi:hypothetical protein